jgi:hypothetical protein
MKNPFLITDVIAGVYFRQSDGARLSSHEGHDGSHSTHPRSHSSSSQVSKESKKYGELNKGYQAWYAGQPLSEAAYPPGLKSVLAGRQAFEQLEDFNKKGKKAATGKK